jgi:hypothetical protein
MFWKKPSKGNWVIVTKKLPCFEAIVRFKDKTTLSINVEPTFHTSNGRKLEGICSNNNLDWFIGKLNNNSFFTHNNIMYRTSDIKTVEFKEYFKEFEYSIWEE